MHALFYTRLLLRLVMECNTRNILVNKNQETKVDKKLKENIKIV